MPHQKTFAFAVPQRADPELHSQSTDGYKKSTPPLSITPSNPAVHMLRAQQQKVGGAAP